MDPSLLREDEAKLEPGGKIGWGGGAIRVFRRALLTAGQNHWMVSETCCYEHGQE